MEFIDDSLYPENMDPLIITAAPYGPSWTAAEVSLPRSARIDNAFEPSFFRCGKFETNGSSRWTAAAASNWAKTKTPHECGV
jgi:hypothetical protein